MAWTAAGFAGALAAGTASQNPITELVADRTAVERVYYAHRLGANPPFEKVLPAAEVARLVNADLHKEAVLAKVYHFEVTPAQIEADVKRIELETRAPQMLAEIKAALGNDPARFARAVAKPIVVDRELRRHFENDDRLHSAQRKQMEAAREEILALERRCCLHPAGSAFLRLLCRQDAGSTLKFMESLVDFDAVHWDHEPNEWSAELPFGTILACRTDNAAPNWSSALRFMESTGGTVSEVKWRLGPRPEEARSPDPGTPVALPVKARSSNYSLDATATLPQTLSRADLPGEPADKAWFEDLSPELRNVLRTQLQKPGDVSAVIETRDGFLLFVAKEKTVQSLSATTLLVSKLSFEQWLSEQKE